MLSIKNYRKLLLPVLKRYDIKRAAIFGSVAKGTSGHDSDIDLLIEPQTGFTLFSMLKLEAEIEVLLNKKVDLVEYGAIKSSIKQDILQSAVSIL